MSFIVILLHWHDVGLWYKLVEEGVPALVADLILDGYKHILEVHYGIRQLHWAFWNVCLLPSLLEQFLLLLLLCLWLAFCTCLLQVFDKVILSLLELAQVFSLIVRDTLLQQSHLVFSWGQLVSLKLIHTWEFLKWHITLTMLFEESALRWLVDRLLYLLVQMQDWESKVVPQLRIAFQWERCLLKVSKGLQILFVLIQS